MVGIGTIGGLPRLGGRHPHLVQWAVVTLPKADVGTRREREAHVVFGVNNLGMKGRACVGWLFRSIRALTAGSSNLFFC
jgi:hypothetical protein